MNNDLNTYIGKKGYTIYKESLDSKEHRMIREDLNVRPYIPNAPIQSQSYPVFLESVKKYYTRTAKLFLVFMKSEAGQSCPL